MKKYLEQLLQDLEKAKHHKPPTPNYKELYPDHPAFKYGLDYIVEWEMAPSFTFPELFGLKAAVFPPPEKLSSKQQKILIDKILDLWKAFNYSADFPDGVSTEQIYKAILYYWAKESTTYTSEGWIELDFCMYNVDYCLWGKEHCDCAAMEDDLEDFKPSPVDEAWWKKGIQEHPDGSTSWINPELLDEDGNIKGGSRKDGKDFGELPF